MIGTCACCERNTELKEYHVLKVHVCGYCSTALDRLGAPLLTRAEVSIPADIKHRLVLAVRRMKIPKERKLHHA